MGLTGQHTRLFRESTLDVFYSLYITAHDGTHLGYGISLPFSVPGVEGKERSLPSNFEKTEVSNHACMLESQEKLENHPMAQEYC